MIEFVEKYSMLLAGFNLLYKLKYILFSSYIMLSLLTVSFIFMNTSKYDDYNIVIACVLSFIVFIRYKADKMKNYLIEFVNKYYMLFVEFNILYKIKYSLFSSFIILYLYIVSFILVNTFQYDDYNIIIFILPSFILFTGYKEKGIQAK